MKVKCTHCGVALDVDAASIGKEVKCTECENYFDVVNDKLMPCPDCMNPVSKRAVTCPKCGAPLKDGDDSAKDFHSELEDEQLVEIYHPSAMHYFWLIILGIITIPLLGVGIFIILYVMLDVKFTSYELTTHRVIVRTGWIAKEQNEIWIKDMRGVNFVQTVWQRIIGIGDIAIGTAASAETEICMLGIGSPAQVVKKINSFRES